MNKNRIIAILIAGLMITSSLVACGNGKGPTSESAIESNSKEAFTNEAGSGGMTLESADDITYRTDSFWGCTYQVPEDWDDPVYRNEYYAVYIFNEDNQIGFSYVDGNSSEIDWNEFRESQVADMDPDMYDYRDSGLITEENVEGCYITSFMHASNGHKGYTFTYYINAKDEGIIMLSKVNVSDESLYSEEFMHILKTLDVSGLNRNYMVFNEDGSGIAHITDYMDEGDDSDTIPQLYKDFISRFEPYMGSLIYNESVEEYLNEKTEIYDVKSADLKEDDKLLEFLFEADNGDKVQIQFSPVNLDDYPDDADSWIWTLSLLKYDSGNKAIIISDNNHLLTEPEYKTVEMSEGKEKQEAVINANELKEFLFK